MSLQGLAENAHNTTMNSKQDPISVWGIHRHYYDYGNDNFGCKTPALNCFDDIIITANPKASNALDKLIDNHNKGVSVADNDIAIFVDNKRSLSNVIFSEADINNLVDGIYSLRIRSSQGTVSKTENNYYIFEKGTEIKKVYPIRIR